MDNNYSNLRNLQSWAFWRVVRCLVQQARRSRIHPSMDPGTSMYLPTHQAWICRYLIFIQRPPF
jgi:hypothetical protein